MNYKLHKKLLKLLCCFVPSRRIRKRLHGGFDKHFYFKAKKAAMLAPQIETLVVGSSHAECGFYETPRDVNFGIASQDLYYSYQLYMKSLLMFPNLKRVVLFYSDFSDGNEEERSMFLEESAKYMQYFGIPPKNPVFYADKQIDLCPKFAPYEVKTPDFDDPYPFPAPVFNMPENTVKTRVEKHLKGAFRGSSQTMFVERIIRSALTEGLDLTIVVAPARADYLSFVPADAKPFEKLENLLKKYDGKVRYLNCWRDADFTDADFTDCDHLNRSGAEKLTAKIRSARNG